MKHCLVLLVLICLTAAVRAQSGLDALLQSDQLRLRSWLEPAGDIVAGQQVELVVEVATRSWFAGGTRIRRPEIADAIVLQREEFATNLTRRESGVTWTVQQHSLSIFPRTPGSYRVPALQLRLAVAGAGGARIEGEVSTQALQFEAGRPAGVPANARWIAAPEFAVTSRFDRDPVDLQVGDALVRTVVFRATTIPAMLLPALTTRTAEGLSIYRKSPRLTDRSNRGVSSAERVETITYVFERAGIYQLPEQEFLWWNVAGGSLQRLRIEPVSLQVGGGAGVADAAAPGSASESRLALAAIWMLAALVLVGVVAMLRRLRWQSKEQMANRRELPAARSLRRQFRAAATEGRYRDALSLLYRWYDLYSPGFDGQLRPLLERRQTGTAAASFESLSRHSCAPDPGAAGSEAHWRSLEPQASSEPGRDSSPWRLN